MSNDKEVIGSISLEQGLARIRARAVPKTEGVSCPNGFLYADGTESFWTPVVPTSMMPKSFQRLAATETPENSYFARFDAAMAEIEAKHRGPVSADSREPRLTQDYFVRFDAACAGFPQQYEF